MNEMSHVIAAEPTVEHARAVLRKRFFDNTVICITEELYKGMRSEFGDDTISAAGDIYPDIIRVFMSKYADGRNFDGTVFSTAKLLPDFENCFGDYNTIFIMPLHFQDSIAGYFMTHYSPMEHYAELLYTFSSYLNTCIETMNMHERLTGLNRKMEFLFTHDQLTKIYNRYGFYNSFKQNFTEAQGGAKLRGEQYHKSFGEALARLNSQSGKPFAVVASVGVFSADLTDVESVDGLIELADRLMYNDKARYKRHPRN